MPAPTTTTNPVNNSVSLSQLSNNAPTPQTVYGTSFNEVSPALRSADNYNVSQGKKSVINPNYSSPASTQSTTTLSSNKNTDIKGIQNTTNQYAQGGVTTNPETGISQTASGQAYTPYTTPEAPKTSKSGTTDTGGYYGETYYAAGSQLPTDSTGKAVNLTATSPTNDRIMQSLNDQKAQSDALTSQMVAQIENQYAALQKQQEQVNAGANAATQGALFRSGAAQGDAYAQNAVQYQVQQGVSALADLNNKKQAAILQAQQAGQTQNFKLQEQINNQIAQIAQQQAAAGQKLSDQIMAAQQKSQEAQLQQQKDSAISDIYQSGITDVGGILSSLKRSGFTDVTAKDVSDSLKNTGVDEINSIAKDAANNGGTLAQIHEISNAKSPAEAQGIVAKYGLGQDKLDVQYKKAQIAKIYKDIQDSGVQGQDASTLLAYANQYASTGTIPSGLPKGTFGVISQVAKELPKSNGQIIDKATGVTPDKLGAAGDAYGALYSAIDLSKQLKELDKNRVGGIISGTVGKIFGSEDQQKYIDLRSQIVDLLSRARSGAALTPSEEKRYEDMLPGRFSEKFGLGVDSDKRIDNFTTALTSDLTNKANTKGWAVYGISKVKPSGADREYTIGETIEVNGVHGRVNPDGTITVL